jgi:hypothetical protein
MVELNNDLVHPMADSMMMMVPKSPSHGRIARGLFRVRRSLALKYVARDQ